ncbi:MAG: hypothetical protein GYA23_07040 [Methanomicrobiales archaeon]|nr:hypothetical protein [Methanomicrobiales archaeon]
MDELVAVGAAGILGLVITALLILGGIAWGIAGVWDAFRTGNWEPVAQAALVLVVLLAAYTGTGLWLRATGRI